MKTVANFDLSHASQIYGVSNTPLFLIRKLQADPTIKEISDSVSSKDIVEAIKTSVSREPENPVEAVTPYALLVALWFKPEIEPLQQVADLAAPGFSWFQFIVGVLIEKFSPTQRQTIQVPSQLSTASISITTSTPASRIILAS